MAPQTLPNADNRPSEDVVVRKSVRVSNPPKYLAEYVLTNKWHVMYLERVHLCNITDISLVCFK